MSLTQRLFHDGHSNTEHTGSCVGNIEIVLDHLMRLNSIDKPGLSEAEFKKLFALCHCGLMMTRQVFGGHTRRPIPVIINLTSDESEDSAGTESDPVIIDLTGDSDDD